MNGDPSDIVVREVSVLEYVNFAEAREIRIDGLTLRRRSFTLRYSIRDGWSRLVPGAWGALDDLGNEYRGLDDDGKRVALAWNGNIRFIGPLHEEAMTVSLWPLAVGDPRVPIVVKAEGIVDLDRSMDAG